MDLQWKNTTDHYGVAARLFHWVIGIGIIGMMCLGWYMEGLEKGAPNRDLIYGFHKSFGVLILVLAFLRIIWALLNMKPALPAGMKAWEALSAKIVHLVLYVLIVLMPLSGYLWSSSGGYGISFFGLFKVPLLPKNESYLEIGGTVHEALAIATAIIVGIHVLAALKHHFVDKDTVLKRML